MATRNAVGELPVETERNFSALASFSEKPSRMEPTPDLAALMAGLLAAPRWNTAARMAIADCMIETGQEEWIRRGEFIRLQLAYEDCRNMRTKKRIGREAGKLFGWNAVRLRTWEPVTHWLDVVDGGITCEGGGYQYGGAYGAGRVRRGRGYVPGGRDRNATVRRGFIDHVDMTPEEWLLYGDRLLELSPVRSVSLDRYPYWRVVSFDAAMEVTGDPGELLSLVGFNRQADEWEFSGRLVKDTIRSVAGIASVPVGFALMMLRFPLIETWSLSMARSKKKLTIVRDDLGWYVEGSR